MTVTMPSNGLFLAKCMHCDKPMGKPEKYKNKEQDFSLQECPKCHGLTLIRYSEDMATLFQVND